MGAAFALSPIVWLHYFVLLYIPIAIVRPRLSWLWALPLAFWVCRGQSIDGALWEKVRKHKDLALTPRIGSAPLIVYAIFVATGDRHLSPLGDRNEPSIEMMPGTDASRRRSPVSNVSIALSVIVPVFDQANMIAANVQTIRDRIAAGMDEPFEIIVVSDGSVDGTAERVIERDIADVRVLYYDRNLGKGYAVKTGAREARGRWVGYVDADLDLDPAAFPVTWRPQSARGSTSRSARSDTRTRRSSTHARVSSHRGCTSSSSACCSSSTSATPRSGSRSSGGRWRRRSCRSCS